MKKDKNKKIEVNNEFPWQIFAISSAGLLVLLLVMLLGFMLFMALTSVASLLFYMPLMPFMFLLAPFVPPNELMLDIPLASFVAPMERLFSSIMVPAVFGIIVLSCFAIIASIESRLKAKYSLGPLENQATKKIDAQKNKSLFQPSKSLTNHLNYIRKKGVKTKSKTIPAKTDNTVNALSKRKAKI